MGVKELSTYDIEKDYYENFERGPRFSGSFPENLKNNEVILFDKKADFPLGIPAGLLLNGNWVKFYARMGFPILIYKTVRSREYPCLPFPNCLFVKTGMFQPDRIPEVVLAPKGYEPEDVRKVTITNSFGMPSMSPDYWQEDMERTLKSLPPGVLMWGSGVGTFEGSEEKLIEDFVTVALMMKETGVSTIVLNFSCPNVAEGEGAVYLDAELSKRILVRVKKAVPDVPVIVKVGFICGSLLRDFVKAIASYVDGISGINSLQLKVVNELGKPALGKDREKSGVCGWAIRECAKLFVRELVELKEKEKYDFLVFACGGVSDKESYREFINLGADVVFTCTAAMFNPYLASEIRSL